MKYSKKGFTLAEILVTLGVIGVIASMTVPTLVQDIQDAQFKTAWKKTFADINQVTARIIQDNAGSMKQLCADLDNNCFRDRYSAYLSYVKSCNSYQSRGNCWPSTIKYKKGSITSWYDTAGIVLNNGALLIFALDNLDCTYLTNGASGIKRCGWITTDVNGFKGPNTFGKDIYIMHIRENSVSPYGVVGDGKENTCTSTTLGYSCSAEYLYQ